MVWSELTLEEHAEVWRRYRTGESMRSIRRGLGRSLQAVRRLISARGGRAPRPRSLSARRRSQAEREEISRGVAAGASCRQIVGRLGRAPSTVSREIARNGGRQQYRARRAAAAARAEPGARRSPSWPSAVACGDSSRTRWLYAGRRGRSRAGYPACIRTMRSGACPRDHLPVALRAAAGTLRKQLTRYPADPPQGGPSAGPGRAGPRPTPRRGLHQRAPGRGGRSGGARPLGRPPAAGAATAGSPPSSSARPALRS